MYTNNCLATGLDSGRGDMILGRHGKLAVCRSLVLCVFSMPRCPSTVLQPRSLACVCRVRPGNGGEMYETFVKLLASTAVSNPFSTGQRCSCENLMPEELRRRGWRRVNAGEASLAHPPLTSCCAAFS